MLSDAALMRQSLNGTRTTPGYIVRTAYGFSWHWLRSMQNYVGS